MISEHAIIHPTARIASGVTIGPGTVIGEGVEIGEGTWIGPHAVIQGPTVIGKHNKIFQFSSLGDEPQAVNYLGEPTRLEIGDHNVIREFCTISRGTVKGGSVTRVGNHNFLMAYSHIGHDCHVGNYVTLVSYGALSGHVTIHDYAVIGGYAAVHQFCQVGAYAFIARATYVPKDVLPYVMVAGYSSSTCGINTVGLKRRGFSSATVDMIRRAYKIVFRKGLSALEAVAELETMLPECPEVQLMIDSINHSTRGIAR